MRTVTAPCRFVLAACRKTKCASALVIPGSITKAHISTRHNVSSPCGPSLRLPSTSNRPCATRSMEDAHNEFTPIFKIHYCPWPDADQLRLRAETLDRTGTTHRDRTDRKHEDPVCGRLPDRLTGCGGYLWSCQIERCRYQ